MTVGSGESAVRMPRKVAARNDFYAYDFEMDWGFNELGEPRALMKEDARCQKKNAAGKVRPTPGLRCHFAIPPPTPGVRQAGFLPGAGGRGHGAGPRARARRGRNPVAS